MAKPSKSPTQNVGPKNVLEIQTSHRRRFAHEPRTTFGPYEPEIWDQVSARAEASESFPIDIQWTFFLRGKEYQLVGDLVFFELIEKRYDFFGDSYWVEIPFAVMHSLVDPRTIPWSLTAFNWYGLREMMDA